MMPSLCWRTWKQESIMNIETNSPGDYTDVAALEKLVNEFFRALPGQTPSPQMPAASPSLAKVASSLTDYGKQAEQAPDYATVINKGNVFDVKNLQGGSPDPHFPGHRPVPPSVAGSGISPSAVEQVNGVHPVGYASNGVNMSNPQ